MSSWEIWTRIAIAILVFGSVAVFAWFLVEVVALARGRRSTRETREDPDPDR